MNDRAYYRKEFERLWNSIDNINSSNTIAISVNGISTKTMHLNRYFAKELAAFVQTLLFKKDIAFTECDRCKHHFEPKQIVYTIGASFKSINDKHRYILIKIEASIGLIRDDYVLISGILRDKTTFENIQTTWPFLIKE